ncbi:hypothetical protein FRC11_011915, partial [Ceratobasidium sp. 423]
MPENLDFPRPIASAMVSPTGEPPVTDDREVASQSDGGENDALPNELFSMIDLMNVLSLRPKGTTFGPSTGTSSSGSSSPTRSASPPLSSIEQLETENARLKEELKQAIIRANIAKQNLRPFEHEEQMLALRESLPGIDPEFQVQKAVLVTTDDLRSPSFTRPISPVAPVGVVISEEQEPRPKPPD